ncbi:MAG: hypothetical protein AB7U63_13295 [Porticoccaceae bacterium]
MTLIAIILPTVFNSSCRNRLVHIDKDQFCNNHAQSWLLTIERHFTPAISSADVLHQAQPSIIKDSMFP